MNKNTDFPQYRRLSQLDVYYKILNGLTFYEVKRLGSKWMSTRVEAEQYPEKLKIMDMLENVSPYEFIDDLEIISLIEAQLQA